AVMSTSAIVAPGISTRCNSENAPGRSSRFRRTKALAAESKRSISERKVERASLDRHRCAPAPANLPASRRQHGVAHVDPDHAKTVGQQRAQLPGDAPEVEDAAAGPRT